MIKFSLKGRDSEVLRAFVRERLLMPEEVDSGFLTKNNYPYEIVFDKLDDGILIMENLPCKVLVSYQTLKGGRAFAVIRLLKERN